MEEHTPTQSLPSGEIIAVNEPEKPKEAPVDTELVNSAVVKIKLIYLEHAQNAYLEVAQYLFDNFFDSNYDLMRNKTPAEGKDASFNALAKRLKEEDVSLPGRTWLHNSVRLLAEKEDIEGKPDMEEVVHTYGQLPVSHKIAMLPLDFERKKDLILEIDQGHLTVRQTKEKVAELCNKGKKSGSGRVIKYDKKIQSIEKQVSKWQEQIENTLKKSADKQEEFKELSKLLKKLLAGISNLQKN